MLNILQTDEDVEDVDVGEDEEGDDIDVSFPCLILFYLFVKENAFLR